jgi:hypothetical protein
MSIQRKKNHDIMLKNLIICVLYGFWPYMRGAIARVATSTRSQTRGTNGAEIVSENNDQLQFEKLFNWLDW